MIGGLQVFSSAGEIQIDTSQMTQRLLKSQTITLQKSFWGNADAKTQIAVRGKMPMIFFADAIGATGYLHNRYRVERVSVSGSGEVKDWVFYLSISSPALPSITSYTFRVYFFDSMPPQRTNFGLETFDELGRLTFSSYTPPLDIKASYSVPEYIEPFQFGCETFKEIPGLVIDKTAVSLNFYRSGFYASETTTTYIDVAAEYVSFANLVYPPTEAITGVSLGLYMTGETINDFGAQEGATCFGSGVPLVTVIDITQMPMPFE